MSPRIVAFALAALAITPATAIAARTAYVSDDGGAPDVTAQLVVGSGGALAPLGAPGLEAVSPRRMTMTPDGTSLYLTAGASGSGVVRQYDVAANGAATPKAVAALPAGKNPTAIAIDPAGKMVWVADKTTGDLRQFLIGPGGSLAPFKPTQPLQLHGGVVGLTVAPDGKSAFMTVDGFVKRMAVGADGGLDAATLTGLDTRADLTDVALTPDGRHLYASSRDRRIFRFEVADDGTFTQVTPPVSSGGSTTKFSSLAISADGKSLYAAAELGSAGTLFQYTIGTDGALAPKGTASLPLAQKPSDLAITPDGRSLYVTAGDLALFDLDSTGLAAPKTPATFDLAHAVGLVVSPNQAPVARFEIAIAPAGSAVEFDASTASDPDGAITRYDWDFGDGTTLENGGPRVAHVYGQPGEYEVKLVVTDNEGASTLTTFTGNSVLGNGSPAAAITRIVVVAAPVLPITAPPAPPAPFVAQPARPELGESVIVEPEEGLVRVRLPGRQNFVNLRTLRVIPVGSLVDARRGKALLSSVRDGSGDVQQGHFSQGLFQVRQRRSERYLTELVMRGELDCPEEGEASAARRAARKLWGNADGRFRTRGRYSSGAVRGTRWVVADSCEGTRTAVRRGRVAVRDFTDDSLHILTRGESYLASPG